ncbi:hypothetical protein M433DRAFT_158557, partial [Acidomyces richmondensis BFW]
MLKSKLDHTIESSQQEPSWGVARTMPLLDIVALYWSFCPSSGQVSIPRSTTSATPNKTADSEPK